MKKILSLNPLIISIFFIILFLGADIIINIYTHKNILHMEHLKAITVILLFILFGYMSYKMQNRIIKEEKLTRKEETRYRELFNSINDAVMVHERDRHGLPGKFTEVNEITCNMLGYTKEELLNMKPYDIEEPEMLKNTSLIIDKLFKEKNVLWEGNYVRKNGEIFNVEISSHLFEIDEKFIIISTIRDITERKKMLEKLIEKEHYKNTIFNSIYNGIMLIDGSSHKIVDINPSGEKMFGAKKEDIIGKICHKYICPAENGMCPISDLGQTVDNSERILINSSGENIPVIKTVTNVVLEGKKYLLESFLDISERKKMEEEIRQDQKMEGLDTMAGGISHNLNNILSELLIYSEMTIMELSPDSKARTNIQKILNTSYKATDITKQILAYLGLNKFIVEKIIINSIIKSMKQVIDISLPQNCSIKYELQDELPYIEGDATQINQMIMNIITNSYESMETKGEITISTGIAEEITKSELGENNFIEKREREDLVYIKISDTGMGMEKDIQGKIFDPFFTTKFTGRGLGLSVVKGIVKCHKGAIKVHSEKGKGTDITIFFQKSINSIEL